MRPQARTWFLKRFLFGIGVFLSLQAIFIGGGIPLTLHFYQKGQWELLTREALGVILDHSHQVSPEVLSGGPFIVFDRSGKLVYSNRGQGRSLDREALTPVFSDGSKVGSVYTGETAFLTQEANKRFLHSLTQLFLLSLVASLGVGLVWARMSAGRLTGLFQDLRKDLESLPSRVSVPVRLTPFQELEDITRGLESLGETLREADKRQKEFLQDITHDLRTPLAGIRGQLEALSDGVLEPDPVRFKNMLGETDRLVEMINDLSLLFRTESLKTLNLEHFETWDNFRELQHRFEKEISENRIQWVQEGSSIKILADRNLLLRALGNVVENSLRYAAGLNVLKLGSMLQDNVIVFWIQDDGPGVEEKDRSRLFERHWRGDQGRTTPGSGLGLSIAASIVRKHGGDIDATEAIGGGLRIEIRISHIL